MRVLAHRHPGKTPPTSELWLRRVRALLDHAAVADPAFARRLAVRLLPHLPRHVIDKLLDEVGDGRFWDADALGREIGLTQSIRTKCNVGTINALDDAAVVARWRCERAAAERPALHINRAVEYDPHQARQSGARDAGGDNDDGEAAICGELGARDAGVCRAERRG